MILVLSFRWLLESVVNELYNSKEYIWCNLACKTCNLLFLISAQTTIVEGEGAKVSTFWVCCVLLEAKWSMQPPLYQTLKLHRNLEINLMTTFSCFPPKIVCQKG